MSVNSKPRDRAAEIVRDAGGKVVGRTKLQKIACLLELADLGSNFQFEYRHYGPYSEELADAIRSASAFKLVEEDERVAAWGGRYSIYTVSSDFRVVNQTHDQLRQVLAKKAAEFDSVELELAVTAAYLFAEEGCEDPWGEVSKRKSQKAADGRLEKAKNAYEELRSLDGIKLPEI